MKQYLKIIILFCLPVIGWLGCQQASFDSGLRPETGISLDSLIKRVAIPSEVMSSIHNANIILPENYFLDSVVTFYPVVYLLHGYNGDYDDWLSRVPDLVSLASLHNFIIVMPDGKNNSWYVDSPIRANSKFFTYISTEVPNYVDTYFRTKKGPRSKAITGLSMGGHGALLAALNRPSVFGAAGSMSGIVDLSFFSNQWELKQYLGDPLIDSLNWEANNIIEQIGNKQQIPQLIIDCGQEDFALQVNRSLHQKLDTLNIPHTYTERPGGHAWDYWSEAIQFQLLFFAQYFEEP